MARWEPNAAGRLRDAAMELYVERGYEQTTVADIAERAGLTPRTFFRYFTDKREVLFNGSQALEAAMLEALEKPTANPMDAVAAALDAAAQMLGTRRDFSRARQTIIDSSAELRERELIKLASLAESLAAGLREHGIPDPQAGLAAETGIAVFRVAYARWIAESEERTLADVMHESLQQLTALTR